MSKEPYNPPPANRRVLSQIPDNDQPKYRLQHLGTSALSTSELLALILGTADGLHLADNLLTRFGSLHQLARANKQQLMHISGIGEAQSARLTSMIELARRLQIPPDINRLKITSPEGAANVMLSRLQHLPQEELHVMCLNTRNEIIGTHCIYKGSLNTSVIRVAEIFRVAIEAPAASIIVFHNHPSGNASPSPEDVAMTRHIVQAGDLLNIEVLDHIIIGQCQFVSLKERGLGFS